MQHLADDVKVNKSKFYSCSTLFWAAYLCDAHVWHVLTKGSHSFTSHQLVYLQV